MATGLLLLLLCAQDGNSKKLDEYIKQLKENEDTTKTNN